MAERLLEIDGVSLCVEAFGSPADPTVLLVAGGGQSMVWWETELCARLAEGGRHVVRYDHRDTGRSTSSPAGRPTYTAADFAGDPLRVLDSLGIGRAHLVGLSMGGGVVQRLGLEHPSRAATLCLMSTSPVVPGPVARRLPPPTEAMAASFSEPVPEPDWSDRDAVVDHRVAVERPYAGTLGFDEPRVRRLAALEADRTTDMAASMTNHFLLDDDTALVDQRLARLAAPTLVVHGTADPLFPIEHGRALAEDVPGAVLLPLPGVGHQQPPPETWDVVVPALLDHTSPH